jgi:hypothetical protein
MSYGDYRRRTRRPERSGRRERSIADWKSAPEQPPTSEDHSDSRVAYLSECRTSGRQGTMDYSESDGNYLHGAQFLVRKLYRKAGYPALYFDAFSYTHGEERTFRVDRIRRFGSEAGLPNAKPGARQHPVSPSPTPSTTPSSGNWQAEPPKPARGSNVAAPATLARPDSSSKIDSSSGESGCIGCGCAVTAAIVYALMIAGAHR